MSKTILRQKPIEHFIDIEPTEDQYAIVVFIKRDRNTLNLEEELRIVGCKGINETIYTNKTSRENFLVLHEYQEDFNKFIDNDSDIYEHTYRTCYISNYISPICDLVPEIEYVLIFTYKLSNDLEIDSLQCYTRNVDDNVEVYADCDSVFISEKSCPATKFRVKGCRKFVAQDETKPNVYTGNKKIFVSLGMSGRRENYVRADLQRAQRLINKKFKGFELVHNYDCPPPKDDLDPKYYLKEALKKLLDCDACLVMDGWENYDGCRAEVSVCLDCNIPIFTENLKRIRTREF